MRFQKDHALLFIFAGILLFIITAILAIVAFTLSTSPKQLYTGPPTTAVTPNTNPPVQWDPDASNKLLQTLNTRPTLPPSDTEAKAKILSYLPAGQKSGTLYQSSNVRVDYVSNANVFQGEILTVDIAAGKEDAEKWFKSQGMSQQGICNSPLEFYLNFQIANQLRDTHIIFNPLPDGC